MTSASTDVGLTPSTGARYARAFDRRLLALAVRERGALVSSVVLGLTIAAARVGTGAAVAFGLGAVLRTGAWHATLAWIGVAVGLILVRALLTTVQSATLAGASVRITTKLRMRLVSTILTLGPRWLARERSGELQSVLVDGVERLDDYFRLFLAKVAAAAISAVAILSTVVIIDPPTGACIAVLAAAVILAPPAEYRALGRRMRFWSESYRPLSAEFVDNLQGMTTLKTFGVAEERGRELRRRSADIRDAAIRLVTVSGYFKGLTTVAAAAGVAAGLAVGGFRLASGDLSTQELLLILLLAGECFLPSREISNAMHTAVWGMSKVERTFTILQTEPSGTSVVSQRPTVTAAPTISFEEVTFGYRPDRYTLKSVSFTVGSGETVAIVGPSGAGKTTIAALLLRFFDPDSGRTCIDGIDIAHLHPDVVRESIALVPQDAFLFHATIRDNLKIADPDASDARLWQVLAAAGAEEFVRSLPAGLDTVVGERGLRLSGGQRQRIAIARALLKDAPILILDEATSNVDVATEESIQESLRALRRGRTTLIIAHRLSTVRDADRILVLDDGRIAEHGAHDQLIQQRGRYAALVAAQATP